MPFPFHTRFHFHGIILPSLSTSRHSSRFCSCLHLTACQQFSNHSHSLCHFFIVFSCSRTPRSLDLFFSTFPLLCGDIELHPRPSNFTVCTLNTRSILHPLHSAALSDLVDLHKLDLVCLSVTWIKPTTTSTEMINCTPPGYTFVSTPRNFTKSSSSTGGGTDFLIREPFTQLPLSVTTFSSFESSFLILKLPQSNLSVSVSIVLRHHPRTPSLPLFFSMNLVPSFLQRLHNF